MKKLLNKKWANGKNILVFLLGVAIIYISVTLVTESRLKEIELTTRDLIANQKALLVAIAETTARNGADQVTETIVKDCNVQERSSLDSLLGKLDSGLSNTQLVELDRLFGRCGYFFSERKSVMVARLAREMEVFEDYVNQLSAILNKDLSKEFLVEEWRELAKEEAKQSDLFTRLVTMQDKIINTLLSGSSVNSPEIEEILFEVNEIQGMLVVVQAQASKVRSRLVSL